MNLQILLEKENDAKLGIGQDSWLSFNNILYTKKHILTVFTEIILTEVFTVNTVSSQKVI